VANPAVSLMWHQAGTLSPDTTAQFLRLYRCVLGKRTPIVVTAPYRSPERRPGEKLC